MIILKSLLTRSLLFYVDVESYWPGLFAKAINGIDVKAIVGNVGVGSGSAPAAGGAAAGG